VEKCGKIGQRRVCFDSRAWLWRNLVSKFQISNFKLRISDFRFKISHSSWRLATRATWTRDTLRPQRGPVSSCSLGRKDKEDWRQLLGACLYFESTMKSLFVSLPLCETLIGLSLDSLWTLFGLSLLKTAPNGHTSSGAANSCRLTCTLNLQSPKRKHAKVAASKELSTAAKEHTGSHSLGPISTHFDISICFGMSHRERHRGTQTENRQLVKAKVAQLCPLTFAFPFPFGPSFSSLTFVSVQRESSAALRQIFLPLSRSFQAAKRTVPN